jgi:fructose-bisphosphate aldolase class II
MIATPEQYARMLDRAKAGGFAFPAVNVTSTQTLNAALRGFTEADSDGIVQISVGGAEYFSGAGVGDAVTGAVAFAEVAHVLAANHPGLVGLHTDHCPPGRVDNFLRPLLAVSQRRLADGGEPLFQSQMWDGSSLPLEENLRLAAELLEQCRQAGIVLELEIGVVGGEEDGITGAMDERLYSTAEDALRVADALGLGERGRFLLAATSTVSIGPATSFCAPLCWERSRMPSGAATDGITRSTWSSMVAPAHRSRTSARPSAMAWSR